jgi:hypothetical protein
MSSTTEEIMQVCEALPADKRPEVGDFARFLLARQDDEAWERRLAYPQARPRLNAFLRDSAAEGDEPLDPNRCDLAHPAEFLAGLRAPPHY